MTPWPRLGWPPLLGHRRERGTAGILEGGQWLAARIGHERRYAITTSTALVRHGEDVAP
ncbi:protein of unknown function [Candidatus Methylocalor cossyra]|uniref:Uncharacterized protein n=1 Tax=Candidatus Methylocalor cossyra TaxID=3108543 RepID=A0ABM9NMQ6_9GAMM